MTDLKKQQRGGGSSSSGTRFSSDKTLPLEYKHVICCNLSQDLLVEILSRLPTKALIRFKCVCKTWCHLISTVVYPHRSVAGLFYQCLNDSLFGGSYEYHRREGQFHFIPMLNRKGGDDSNITDGHLSFLPCHPSTRIVDCRNGLLLCSTKDLNAYDYLICNPVTRQWVALPKQQNAGNAIVALVFFSNDSPHYRVIQFFTSSKFVRKTHLDLDIYSSMTGRWVQSKASVNPPLVGGLQRGNVFVNGALYLLSTVHQILRFDVKYESCHMIELPTELWIPVVSPCAECLGVSDGHLSYSHYDGSIMTIWSLDDTDANGWVVKHTVSIHAVDDLPIDSFNILVFHPHLDEVFLQVGDKILSYHFPSKTMGEVCVLNCDDVNYFWFWVQPFSECLCSLEGSVVCLGSTFVDVQKAPHLSSQCQEETDSHLRKTPDLQHELVNKIFSGKAKSSPQTNNNFQLYIPGSVSYIVFDASPGYSLFPSLVVDTLSGSSNEQGASTCDFEHFIDSSVETAYPRSWHVWTFSLNIVPWNPPAKIIVKFEESDETPEFSKQAPEISENY